MKFLRWLLIVPVVAFAEEQPPRIEEPMAVPMESQTSPVSSAPMERMSVSEKDPADKTWIFYTNRIVKVRLRAKAAWSVMEMRETENVGTLSFTISRLPRITFAIVRAPLEDKFENYVSTAALTPLYPTSQSKTSSTLAGRKGVLIKGITEDGRRDESHFSSDGKTFYRVSFSAPSDIWGVAQEDFNAIKKDFRWLD